MTKCHKWLVYNLGNGYVLTPLPATLFPALPYSHKQSLFFNRQENESVVMNERAEES